MKTLVTLLVLLSLLASSTSALRNGNLTAIFSTILSAIDDVQTIISQGNVPIQGPPQEIALLKQFVEDMESISFDEGDGSSLGFQQEEFETGIQGAETEGGQSFGDDNFCKVGLKNIKLILPPFSRAFSVGGKTAAVLRARAFRSNQTLLIQTSIKGKANLLSQLTGLKERSPPQTFPADNHLPRPSLIVALTEAIGDFSFQMIHRVLKEALERTTGDRTDHLTRLIRCEMDSVGCLIGYRGDRVGINSCVSQLISCLQANQPRETEVDVVGNVTSTSRSTVSPNTNRL